jgi:hypothetical protein
MADHHKVAAAKRGAARRAALYEAVEEAMRAIVEDMKANAGIYPYNGGAVSMAELARRAGINESSFYKPQNAELKERATLWLQQLQKKEIVGRKRVRKHQTEVIHDWKNRFEALDSHNIVTNLKLQQLEAENLKLKGEVEALREQLRAVPSNVTPIAKKKR